MNYDHDPFNHNKSVQSEITEWVVKDSIGNIKWKCNLNGTKIIMENKSYDEIESDSSQKEERFVAGFIPFMLLYL